MSKYYKLISVIILFLFSSDLMFCLDKGKVSPEKRALEKSLLFPGWGQLHERQYLKGSIFVTAEVIMIAGMVINNNKGNDSYLNYRLAENSGDAVLWREETEKFDKRRNLFILAGVGIWIANMVDIYIFKSKRKKKRIKISFIRGKNNEVFFDLGYCF